MSRSSGLRGRGGLPPRGRRDRRWRRGRSVRPGSAADALLGEDPEATAGGYAVRGMFEACASLLYPALKENVEAILPWTGCCGRGADRRSCSPGHKPRPPAQLRVLRGAASTARRRCRAMDPYENLGTTELPGTGSIGKEIYGAGEVFWAYLLFEAMARADDPAILVVNTDLLEAASLRGERMARRRFLVYNPTGTPRTFHLIRPGATESPTRARRQLMAASRRRGGDLTRRFGDRARRRRPFGAFCVEAFSDLPE